MSYASPTGTMKVSTGLSCYTWVFPGSPIKVRLALTVVERLQAYLRSHEDTCGLLLGDLAGDATEIHDFAVGLPTPRDRIAASAASAAGYFRITRESVLRLNEADFQLIETLFRNPRQVFLVIQHPESGAANATFFFWDEGRVCGDFALLEFPFDASLLALAEQNRIETAQKRLALQEPASESETSAGARPRTRRERKGSAVYWVLAVAILAATAVGAIAVLWPFPFRIPLSAGLAPAARPSSEVVSKPGEQTPLGLQAERHNGDVKLTWDREAGPVRNATSGVLEIVDGDKNRKITLEPMQLRSGSVLYAPSSEQVQVQLNVLGPNTMVSESILILLPGSGSEQTQPAIRQGTVEAATRPSLSKSHEPIKSFVLPPALQKPQAPADPGPIPAAPVLPEYKAKVPVSLPPSLVTTGMPAAPPARSAESKPAAPPVSNPRSSDATQTEKGVSATAPVILRTVLPTFPQELKRFIVSQKTVAVQVEIDDAGKVTSAKALPAKERIPQFMVDAAISAARLCKFKPAMAGTQPVNSYMVLEFLFKP